MSRPRTKPTPSDDKVAALTRERHTLKRALTDPRLFSGIGNAYSDEILHAARLSPMRQTHQLDADEIGRLHAATHATLRLWIDRLRERAGNLFPDSGDYGEQLGYIAWRKTGRMSGRGGSNSWCEHGTWTGTEHEAKPPLWT